MRLAQPLYMAWCVLFVAAPILIYLGVRASSGVGSAARSEPDAAQPAE